jgi:hypothetical protein
MRILGRLPERLLMLRQHRLERDHVALESL